MRGFRAFVFFSLFVSTTAWPRYGRPHPLYNGRLQSNENIFANAVFLGLDFNDLQSLQAASGNVFGLGNLGLPNSGFPMNAYERKRARQDVNTLTALGVIDGPEEAGPYGQLVKSNRPDPPDNPAGRGNSKQKTGNKTKVIGKSKVQNTTNKSKQKIVNANFQPFKFPNDNAQLIQNENRVDRIKEGQKGVFNGHTKTVEKVIKTNEPKQKLATKVINVSRQNRRPKADKVKNRKGRKGVANKSKKSKTKRTGGNYGEWGDPGEGRLAEKGEMPLKSRGKRIVWGSSGGEDAQIGGGEVLDRRLIVGRFNKDTHQ